MLFVLSPEKFVWLALIAALQFDGAASGQVVVAAAEAEQVGAAAASAAADVEAAEAKPKYWKQSGEAEEAEIKRRASQRQIDRERLREIREIEDRASELHNATLAFGLRGKLILAFGAFLVVLDLFGP